MPNKRLEWFCIREFTKHLTSRFPRSRVHCCSELHDPPDFWLWHDSVKYAVEVTRILNETDRTIEAALWRFVNQAEEAARREGKLSGRYLVTFRGHLTNARQQRELKQRIIDYVAKTADQATSGREDIAISGRAICDIHKYSGQGERIFPLGNGEGIGSFESEVRCELTALLQRAIAGKARKLAKVNSPWVLVLYDLYGLAFQTTFCECVRAVPEAREFKWLYVVEDPGVGYAPIVTASPTV